MPSPETGWTQPVETVGKSARGGRVFALAFVGDTLFLAGKDGLQYIPNASTAAGRAQAQFVPGLPAGLLGKPCHGLASDGVDSLYFECDSAIWRYSVGRGTTDLYVRSGQLADGSEYRFQFNGGSTAALMLDDQGGLWVGTDPGDGTAGNGRAWHVAPQP